MNWSQVKLRDMPTIQALLDVHTPDLIELFDRDVELLSLITGMSEDYINGMSPKEFGKWRTELYKLISTEPASEFNTVLKVNGRKFVFVASCNNVSVKELSELHLIGINEKNFYSKLPLVISVFATEKRFLRKKLSFTEKVELFKELPVDQANGIALFFCKALPELEGIIQNSLVKEIKESQSKLTEALAQMRSTDGGG